MCAGESNGSAVGVGSIGSMTCGRLAREGIAGGETAVDRLPCRTVTGRPS
jgi:hypothetical protein